MALVLALHALLDLGDAVLASDGLHWFLHASLALGVNLMVGLDSHELDTLRVEVLAAIANASHGGHWFLTVAADLRMRLLLRQHFLSYYVWFHVLEYGGSHARHVGLLLG